MSLLSPSAAAKHERSSSTSVTPLSSATSPAARIAAKRVSSATLKAKLPSSVSKEKLKENTPLSLPKPAGGKPGVASPVAKLVLSPSDKAEEAEFKEVAASESKDEQNVQVAVRLRPLIAREAKDGVCTRVIDSHSLMIADKEKNINDKMFSFDAVFSEKDDQQTVFDRVVRPVVTSFLNGFNGTVFAYGQTGSGKTFTMHGDVKNPQNAGVTWRVAQQIIQFVEAKSATHTIVIEAMFLELYQERLIDLLVDRKDKSDEDSLSIREHPTEGVYVAGARVRSVTKIDDLMAILAEGNSRRTVAETKMNDASSRSHSVLTIRLTQSDKNDDWAKAHSQLHLIDLAGSERVETTGATGTRLREGAQINQSLSALGAVIKKLVEGSQHVPFRDSKLTRILQNSLGGNCKTLLIANLSPAESNASESLSTLRFATRAKLIKNTALLGVSPEAQKRLELQKQIAALQARIQELEAMSSDPDGQSKAIPSSCATCGHPGVRLCPTCNQPGGAPACRCCPHVLRVPCACFQSCLCGRPAAGSSRAVRFGSSALHALGVLFLVLLLAMVLFPPVRDLVAGFIVHCPPAVYMPSRLDLAIDFVVDHVAGFARSGWLF